jgi:hypothetical protein
MSCGFKKHLGDRQVLGGHQASFLLAHLSGFSGNRASGRQQGKLLFNSNIENAEDNK